MGRRSNPIGVMAVFVGIFMVIIYLAGGNGVTIGLSASLTTDLITILPGLFVSIVCVIGLGSQNGPLSVGAAGVLGIGLAVLLGELHTLGTLTDAMLAPATLAQYQTIVVVAGFLLGAVKYSMGEN